MYVVKISTDFKTSTLIEELLLSQELSPSSFYCVESCIAEIFFYGETLSEAEELRDVVEKHLENWHDSFQFSKSVVSIEKIKKEDWAHSWKKFFHVEKVSDRIVIKPSWEEYQAVEDEIIVEIDPGMSFGTGIHPTTRACIRFLDKLSIHNMTGSVIDMGCGSGILSIVAAKLGFNPVYAFDSDLESVRITAENTKRAKLDGEVTLFQKFIEDYRGSADFDIVVVNMLGPTLMANVKNIMSALKKDKRSLLIISGILNKQYEDVLKLFMDEGMEEFESLVIGEWTTGLLRMRRD